MGYRIIKQYYEMTLNDTFENNNRGDKSKTIRRGYFMKYFLTILLVINGIFGSVFAQQYPVRLVPVVFPPYNVRLSDYALNSEPKLQLQVLMTDLLEPPHKTGIKFSLESGGRVIAVSTPFVNGLEPFMLHPGSPISLSNLDLKPLFKLENLSGISPSNYARALPDGLYQYCFQAYDFYTKNNLSQKSCASVYQVLYEPPFLNLPQKGEKVTKKAEFQGLVFNWSPRQIAPNTKYFFTLKEIWDKQRDPESAFLAARVLCKEETFAPSLYYGVDKTQLIPGKRYAWQVQAVSGTPQYNHSPIQEGGVYKNNGLSEIFFFDYVENCPVPAFLMAKTAARGRAEIQWMLQGASSKLFRVEYRKKGSSSPWLSETSYQNSAILSGLENNTEYEYRVGAVCGENKSFDPNDLSQADAFAYSGVQYFTTNFSNPNKNSAQCGVMPHVDLANKKPYDRPLTPNEVFTAGDFPVTVITAQGTAGNYTGEGFIQVPYLADTKIKVIFNNIQLNSEKQLINGSVETAYDANESAVHYASAGLGEIFGDKGIKDIKINYEIERITFVMTPAPGVLRIVGIDPNGENKGPVQELPAGRDYTITDSSGKIWQVDEQGTVTEGEKIAQSRKSNADNTEGVKTSVSGNVSEISQYYANGVAIKWLSKEGSHFYFDTPDITKIPFDRYPQVKDTKGRNIVIPYKAVVKGQKEFIGARIIIEDPKLKEAKIEFKVLGSGKLINAELVSNTGNQREYNLELKGVFSYGEEEIIAVLLPSEKEQKTNKEDNKQKELKEAKQKIIGSFRLVYLEPKNVNLSLVPLDKASEAILDTIAENIHNTYSKAGINFDIKKQSVLDISTITTKDIDTPDDNPLSHYSKMQQSINRLYPAKINEYVLFITEKASSTGQKGFMPLGGQYGYVYKSKDKNTPAHELGHGVFRLEHPWSNKLIKTPQAATNLLMDYAGGAELSHFDWKQINDPKIKIYAFQKQAEGSYETDGHYSTVYLVCLILGMNPDLALKLAIAGEAPDTTIHSETKFEINDTWANRTHQLETHSLTDGFHGADELITALLFMYTKPDDIETLGKLLHRFGDTYSHTEISNTPDWKQVEFVNISGHVSPWIDYINKISKEDGLSFLSNVEKQKKYFKGLTFEEYLNQQFLNKSEHPSDGFKMYGDNHFYGIKLPNYTVEHALSSDGSTPDYIWVRPQWYSFYVKNLAYIISQKFGLNYGRFNNQADVFERMINFVAKHKISMKGIIDYEIAKKLGKKEFYIPVFYAKINRPFAYVDANFKTDYIEEAKKAVKNTKKYMIEQGIPEKNIIVKEFKETFEIPSYYKIILK